MEKAGKREKIVDDRETKRPPISPFKNQRESLSLQLTAKRGKRGRGERKREERGETVEPRAIDFEGFGEGRQWSRTDVPSSLPPT